MMHVRIWIALLIFAFITSHGQTMKLLSGGFRELKGNKEYNIEFVYDSMIIGTDTPEREYLKEKKKAWELKEPGKGNEFVLYWFSDRKDFYEPFFISQFEKYSKVKLNSKSAPYTIILKTRRTEGGWNIGIMRHPGEIDGEMWIVASGDHSRVIARVGFYNFNGTNAYGGDFEMTGRIRSAYLLAGKGLGDFLRRKSRK